MWLVLVVMGQHVDAEQPLLKPRELAGVARFDQGPHRDRRPG